MIGGALVLLLLQPPLLSCFLYPRDSPTRSSKSLDGVWSFKLSPKLDQDAGFRDSWFNEPLSNLGRMKCTISGKDDYTDTVKCLDDVLEMPVPASYNDITTNSTIR